MHIGWKINNKIIDLHEEINKIDTLEENKIFKNSEDGERILRHSAAHILGEVIKEKYKNVSFAIGPVTTYGFYYDVLMEENISSHDLIKIENLMREHIYKKKPFNKQYMGKKAAYEFFKDDKCKQLILETIPEDNISIYTNGNFIDLCEGPHVTNSSIIGGDFKLTKVSQINWKGLFLQRIEGVLFYNKERLVNYLSYVEKQNSIDHRKLGEELGLFKHLNVSQGNVFWLENGKKLFQTICDYLEAKYKKYNYKIVKTPLLFQNDLWKTTGHWDKYKDNMYITKDNEVIKPMNCPGHVEVYKIYNASYKELPLRIGEICHVHRKEETGALNGLKRCSGFHQDDGHIFTTIDGVTEEIQQFMNMLDEIYKDFGFNTYKIVLSTRPDNRIGDDSKWDESEGKLINWLKDNNKEFTIATGDGAFYGPKIEIQLEDNFLRKWTCGTLQWDDFLPERLGAIYNTKDNTKLHPIMFHRAILGSIERFIAILLEHYEGHLPLWLCPVQVSILLVSEKFKTYGAKVYQEILKHNIKVILDDSDNTLNGKLKIHLLKKIPYIIIIGDIEEKEEIITVRHKNDNEKSTINEFINKIINLL
jgi:threonyl-tRNA synthetase